MASEAGMRKRKYSAVDTAASVCAQLRSSLHELRGLATSPERAAAAARDCAIYLLDIKESYRSVLLDLEAARAGTFERPTSCTIIIVAFRFS